MKSFIGPKDVKYEIKTKNDYQDKLNELDKNYLEF